MEYFFERSYIEEYKIKGAVKIPNVVSGVKLKDLINNINVLMNQNADNVIFGDSAYFMKFSGSSTCTYMARDIDFFDRFIKNNVLARIAATFSESRSVHFWRDEVFFKAASDARNGTPWHHAIGSLPFKGSQLTIIWITLVEITLDNAPLRTIDVSHSRHRRRYRPPTGRNNLPLLPRYSELPEFDKLLDEGKEQASVWTAKPGDAILFNAYTIHGSLPNVGTSPRIVYVTRWLGDDVVWEPDAYSVSDPAIDPETMIREGRPNSPVLLPRLWPEDAH